MTSVSVLGQQAIQITPKADIFFTGVSGKGRRKIQVCQAGDMSKHPQRTVWKASYKEQNSLPQAKRITCLLPLEVSLVVLGYSCVIHDLQSSSRIDSAIEPQAMVPLEVSRSLTRCTLHRRVDQ